MGKQSPTGTQEDELESAGRLHLIGSLAGLLFLPSSHPRCLKVCYRRPRCFSADASDSDGHGQVPTHKPLQQQQAWGLGQGCWGAGGCGVGLQVDQMALASLCGGRGRRYPLLVDMQLLQLLKELPGKMYENYKHMPLWLEIPHLGILITQIMEEYTFTVE